jgi:cytoskeletal protein RodZ
MKKAHRKLTVKEKKIGLKLREVRLSLGLSQDNVGDILGCVQSYISAIENGHMPLTPAFARVLIKGFKSKYKKVVRPEEFGLDKD